VGRGGFTLVEVLLAIVLLLALAGGMLSYIWGLLASRDRLVATTDQQISAAALFEQLETDLSATFAVDGSGAPGVDGNSTSLVVRSRGVGSLAGTGTSDLGDLQGCEVKFEGNALTARRLGRDETSFETLASPVGRVQFRYFDGKEWQQSFRSSDAGTLPVAVEVSLWFDELSSGNAQAAAGDNTALEEKPTRAPDRVRVMVVPDGPVTSWKSRV
jgi:prepilin-type N-terminal cleavage/methylation domain-containing protein